MKRILFLFVIGSLFAGQTMAQESSRRTRNIQPQKPRQTEKQTEKQQQEVAKATESVESTDMASESPFEDFAEEPATVQATDAASDAAPPTTVQKPTPQGKREATSFRVSSGNEFSTAPQSHQVDSTVVQPQQRTTHQSATDKQDAAKTIVERGHSLTTRIIASQAVNVGQPAELILMAQNHAETEQTGVALSIQLPESVEFISAEPQPVDRSETVAVWELPTLAPGQQTEIRLQVVPYTKQPMEIETAFTIVDRNKVEISVRQPDVKMVVESIDKAIVGQQISHKVKVWNDGDGKADDLKIILGLASDMNLVDASGNATDVGTLGPGESRELTLVTQSNEPGDSPIVYRLAGTGVNVERVGSVTIIVPELYAEILGPKVNIPKRDGAYTINVNNPCEVAISDTRVVLQIPAGMEVTLLSRAGEYNPKDNSISWEFGTIDPGAKETLQFKAQLTGNEDQECKVLIDSRETNSNLLAFETRAYNHTELKLEMRNVTGPVNVGDLAEFVVIASNTGHTAASGVQVEIEIPQWITPTPDESYRIDARNARLIFNAVDVPEGMAAEFKFNGTCTTAGNFVVRSVLNHVSQSQPMVSDAGLFVLDSQTEKVGSIISPDKKIR